MHNSNLKWLAGFQARASRSLLHLVALQPWFVHLELGLGCLEVLWLLELLGCWFEFRRRVFDMRSPAGLDRSTWEFSCEKSSLCILP